MAAQIADVGGGARPGAGWTSRLPLSRRPWLRRSGTAAYSTAPPQRPDIRNVAIVAHVDHGKTTLVAGMLQFARQAMERGQLSSLVPVSGALASSSSAPLLDPGAGRMLDSAALERERGITILARNTSLRWRGVKLNVIDTPGHVDFGGEVERALCMADGVLLLVDAAEGPMPQTRGVLQRALRNDLPVVLVVNKVDRPGADPHAAAAATFDLFVDLGASDEQCEYATVFASGAQGRAGLDPARMEDDLQCLLDAVVRHLPGPRVEPDAPLQLLVADLDHDPHKGRIAVGRVIAGGISRGDEVVHGGGVEEKGGAGEDGSSRRGASA
ncbi:GTP-binding elongation factor EF-Tu/EF-1A, partial [Helicosporidium sp. ATCC 50920]